MSLFDKQVAWKDVGSYTARINGFKVSVENKGKFASWKVGGMFGKYSANGFAPDIDEAKRMANVAASAMPAPDAEK